MGALKFAGRLGGEVLSNVPVGQYAAAAYPQYGMTIGDTKLPTRKDLFGKGDATRFGTGPILAKALTEPQYRIIPPFGGAQINKTKGMYDVMKQGYYATSGGNVIAPAPTNPLEIAKGYVFGKSTTPTYQNFYNSGQSEMGTNQSAIFKALTGNDRVQYYNDRNTGLEQNKVINQLKNGVAPKPEDKAKITTYPISGVSQNGYVIGNKFIYQDEDGEWKQPTIEQVERNDMKYQKGIIDSEYSLASDRLKRADDDAGWAKLTETYIDYLKEYKTKLDPVEDAKELLTIQNTIEDKLYSIGVSKKGKAPAKVTLRKISAPAKITFKGIGARVGLKSVKLTKPKKLVQKKLKLTLAGTQKVTYKINIPPKIKGLTAGVKLV